MYWTIAYRLQSILPLPRVLLRSVREQISIFLQKEKKKSRADLRQCRPAPQPSFSQVILLSMPALITILSPPVSQSLHVSALAQSSFFPSDLPVSEGQRPSGLQKTFRSHLVRPPRFYRLGGNPEGNTRSHRKPVAEPDNSDLLGLFCYMTLLSLIHLLFGPNIFLLPFRGSTALNFKHHFSKVYIIYFQSSRMRIRFKCSKILHTCVFLNNH